MDETIFASMREQLLPSPEAQAALRQKLAQAGPARKPVPWRKYAAAAACAALILGAWPAWQLTHTDPDAPLHSYVVDPDRGVPVQQFTSAGETAAPTEGEGDLPPAPVPAPAPNTGDLPGDVPTQEAALHAYEALMGWFRTDYGSSFPDWYGGAYINEYNDLVVNVVSSYHQAEDPKALLIHIEEQVGAPLVFGDVPYSLNRLQDLLAQVTALPEMEALDSWGCGVNEREGRLDLSVPAVNDGLLAALARLDPAGDAIRVETGQNVAYAENLPAEVPIPTPTPVQSK